MNRVYIALAAMIVIAAGLYFGLQPASGPGSPPISASENDAAGQAAEVDLSLVQEMSLGNPDAALTVIEYASFTCPHCRTFHADAFKRLKSEFIDSGKVYFIYREVYFDRFGLWAGLVARCGGPTRYFGVVDILYQEQTEWIQGDTPAEVADNLRRIGRASGLSDADLDSCLADADKAQAMVALYEQNAAADGINSTPSFVVDGTKYGNMSYGDFATLLNDKLDG